MIRLAAVVATALACASPVWSLSCVAPDIARDYKRAAESPDTYIVVLGDLFFDETALPGRMDRGATTQRDGLEIAGWLRGRSLTGDGFTKAFERDVTLRVSCLGPWCGSTGKGLHLAFLKQEKMDLVIELGPCPGMTYPDPSAEQQARVLSCFRGEACDED